MSAVSVITALFFFTVPGALINSHSRPEPMNTELRIEAHPRLLMTRKKQLEIQDQIKNDSSFHTIHRLILKHADRYAKETPGDLQKTGRRLLEPASQYSKRILTLSYAWRFTKDTRYLSAAIRFMNVLCDRSDWNPAHFLDVAEITLAISIGYDWLYDDLSEIQREIFETAIIKKGLQPSMDAQFNGWLQRTNNWNQVCNAGMVVGALAVWESEKESARSILLRSIESNDNALEVYQPDGNWPEGYGYWSFGTHHQIIIITAMETALQNTFSMSIPAGFWKTPDYLRQLTGPSGYCFNYSDSDATAKINPSMFWFAARKQDASLLWSEQRYLKNPEKISARDLVFLMLWSDSEQFKQIPLPKEKGWYGRGPNPVVVMRSGWNPEDFYVGIKGGSPAVNHGHMDAGSFVLDALGERWVMDLGKEDYHKMESEGLNIWSYKQASDRWKIVKHQTRTHNIPQVNENEQLVNGKAEFESYESDVEKQQAVLNLTSLYQTTLNFFNRTSKLEKNKIQIQDEFINAGRSSNITWRIITDASIDHQQSHQIILTKGGKSIEMIAECQPLCEIKIVPIEKNYAFETIPQEAKMIELNIELKPGQSGTVKATFSKGKISSVYSR